MQIYTPGSGWEWGQPLPFGRGGMGACVCKSGKCYVFGGEVSSQQSPSTENKVSTSRTVYSVDVYDIATNTWSQATVLPHLLPTFQNCVLYITSGVFATWCKLYTSH